MRIWEIIGEAKIPNTGKLFDIISQDAERQAIAREIRQTYNKLYKISVKSPKKPVTNRNSTLWWTEMMKCDTIVQSDGALLEMLDFIISRCRANSP